MNGARIPRLICLALVAFLAASRPVFGVEMIVVDAANAPFMYEESGQAVGLYPAMIAEIFRRLGEPVDIEPVPWQRAQALVEMNAAAIGGLYMTRERAAKYDFSDALYDETLSVYVRAKAVVPYQGVASLAGERIGVLRGWSYGQAFDDAVKAGLFQVEGTVTDLQNIEKLRAGRIDALIATPASAEPMLAAEHLTSEIVALAPPMLVSPAYIAFNKKAGKRALIARINEALAAMRADGGYKKIVARMGR